MRLQRFSTITFEIVARSQFLYFSIYNPFSLDHPAYQLYNYNSSLRHIFFNLKHESDYSVISSDPRFQNYGNFQRFRLIFRFKGIVQILELVYGQQL